MHEYSVIQSLVDSVEAQVAQHPGAIVKRLRVSIGELSGVDTTLLASAYEVFRGGTVCEEALLEIVPVKARWTCKTCGREIPRGEVLRCSSCDAEAKLTSGDEIVLEQVELVIPSREDGQESPGNCDGDPSPSAGLG